MEKNIGNAYQLSSLSLLIPAYNDEATIGRVIAEATRVGKRVAKTFDIILIDDASREPIRPGQFRLIRHTKNQGYGRTIKELYYAGTKEWLFTIPGDYQVGARELEKLIPFSRSADMILGWRVKRNDPPNRLLASWVYNTLLRVLFGVTLHDINSVRLMRRSILQKIPLTSSSAFVDAELVIGAKHQGFRVTEVPISHRRRADTRQGGGNQWGTIVGTIIEMVRFFL